MVTLVDSAFASQAREKKVGFRAVQVLGRGNPLRSVLLVICLDCENSSTWEVVDCFRDRGSRNDLHTTTQLLTRYGALLTQCTAY